VTAVLPDGTRVYKGGARYKPKPAEDRLIGVNKPDHPDAVRFHTRWFLPLDVLEDERREMPETRPDSLAYDHMNKRGMACTCEVCSRPEAGRWQRKWRRDHGLRG
jgi:hypothetical protein